MADICFECRAYLKCPLDVPGDDCEEFEPSRLPEEQEEEG